jgi:hypothetical protein
MDAGPTDADTSAWLVASGVMLAYRPAWCSVIFAPLCPQVSAIDTILQSIGPCRVCSSAWAVLLPLHLCRWPLARRWTGSSASALQEAGCTGHSSRVSAKQQRAATARLPRITWECIIGRASRASARKTAPAERRRGRPAYPTGTSAPALRGGGCIGRLSLAGAMQC